MDLEGRVGLVAGSDGSKHPLRIDKTGAVTIVSAHPLYSEPCLRGNMFVAATAVTGVAPGTALSTTPPFCLWNPLNSGTNLILLKTSVGYVSGTLGAGSIVYAYFTPQATVPSTGAELTPVCTKIGFVKGVGRVFQGSTISGTPLILRPAFNLGAFLATTADPPRTCQDLLEGEIIVPPATCFVMQGVTAAGTSPLVILSAVWEETEI